MKKAVLGVGLVLLLLAACTATDAGLFWGGALAGAGQPPMSPEAEAANAAFIERIYGENIAPTLVPEETPAWNWGEIFGASVLGLLGVGTGSVGSYRFARGVRKIKEKFDDPNQ
jgi:hypothetical protein